MGKSETIDEKMEKDKKFREYMDQLQAESKKEEDRIVEEIAKTIKKHYEGNGWDHARLCGDRKSDYQNYDSWGLDRVITVIDLIGNALSSGDYPSKDLPDSDEASKTTIDNAKEFMGAFAGDYSLIISRVKALVSGILTQFSVASSATRKTDLRDMPLSGGLHLFFGSSGSVFKQESFFANQFMGSFQIVYEIYMSVDEANTIGVQQILARTEWELKMLNDQVIDIRIAQAESLKKILKEDPKNYVSTKLVYDVALDSVKLDIDKLMQEYNRYKNVTNAVDSHFHNLNFAEFKRKTIHDNPVLLEHMFNKWELGIARRYISEKLKINKKDLVTA